MGFCKSRDSSPLLHASLSPRSSWAASTGPSSGRGCATTQGKWWLPRPEPCSPPREDAQTCRTWLLLGAGHSWRGAGLEKGVGRVRERRGEVLEEGAMTLIFTWEEVLKLNTRERGVERKSYCNTYFLRPVILKKKKKAKPLPGSGHQARPAGLQLPVGRGVPHPAGAVRLDPSGFPTPMREGS